MNREIKAARREHKKAFVEKNTKMINDLFIEGLSIANIATEVGATQMSVTNWKNGKPPSVANSELLSRVHEQVMFLKQHGVRYADVMERRTALAAAYIEKKSEEQAA
jgi:hypothetical protein